MMKPDKTQQPGSGTPAPRLRPGSPEPRPSAMTLGILRQFARCYTVDTRLALPLRAIPVN